MVSAKERKRIFWLCNVIGLETVARQDVQESVTGKRHMKDMSTTDAIKVINTLAKIAVTNNLMPKKTQRMSAEESIRKGTQTHSRTSEYGENTYVLASPEQRDKIIALSKHLYRRFDEKSMDSFCIKQFKKSFRKLTAMDARELIEIQKDMIERKLRREGSNDTQK